MTPAVVLITIFAYFIVLFGISYIVGHRADNQGFFVGNRKSPWYVVAFAMNGSMISGVELQTAVRTGTAFLWFAPPRGFASLCDRHCSTCVAQIIRGMMI